ncbi:uncharacterized protein [Linepithema humile]|uniref:uncharacterized protein n=1 Tax=Linepithema humile TaxID=83485 RepID=UPI000623AED5|nr:PREDICTED: uncharacterized protein LOC105675092 [Linepithema humile]
MRSTKHIDDIQTPTIDEHLKLLLKNKSVIDLEAITVTHDDLPTWYDEKLFKEAQNYYRRNMLAMVTSSFMGLFAILSIPETIRVLIYTNKSSMPCVAYSRYVQTLLHMHNLYTCDPSNPDSNWYKTINVIHRKHKMGSKNSKNANVGDIHQRDMALTQFAFVGYVFIAAKSIGLHNKPEEEEAFNHFWRVIGYMLGIPDRLNICRKNAKETRELCLKISSDVLAKYLTEAPPAFYHMVSVIMHGLWHVDVTLNTDALLAFVYQLHGIEYKTSLGWYSWLNLKYRNLIFYLCLVPYIGAVVRIYYNYILMFTFWLVQNWPVHAWISFGKENSQIKMYSILK